MPATADDVGFPILGRALRARRLPAVLRVWLDRHWRRPEHSPPAHPFAISLDYTDAAVASPGLAGRSVRASLPGFELAWRTRDAIWEWRDGGTGVRLELDPGEARIRIRGPAATAECFAAIYLALCEALRASGLLPVHCAAAIPPEADGRATAFLGRTGTGKSTTLLRLARAGWTPLAEDLCWIDAETSALYGWDRGVHLRPGTIEAFVPELANEPWRPGPDGKRFLPYAELSAPAPRRGTLAALALLDPTSSGKAGWEPLPASEAVRALWEAVGVPLAPAARSAAEAWISSVLERFPVHRLPLGASALPGPPR